MSKVNIGIKTTQDLYNNIHSLLDSAKELGRIKEKNEYFEVTYPYFEEYLRRKELTNTDLGSSISEVERATSIIIKQFLSMIDSHESIMKVTEMKQQEQLSQYERKINTLLSVVEKLEVENKRLSSVEAENVSLHNQVEQLKTRIQKMELKHEKELSNLDKEYMQKFTNFQSIFELKRKEVN
ncbi:hypothetical protein D7X33_19175 [Butyricicoccus sp. 1XD8-22]|nr:hypothetical protein D7X33_19175 [Butyricicoccus sp. 1XD8-22]